MSLGHLSISAISQLLLARFGSNFKQKVLEIHTTDYNCHHNICLGNICPYQQYRSCSWPDLDQTLNKRSMKHMQQITTVITTFVKATFVLVTFVHIINIWTHFYQTFWNQAFGGQTFFWPMFSWIQTFKIQNNLVLKSSWAQNSSWIQYLF